MALRGHGPRPLADRVPDGTVPAAIPRSNQWSARLEGIDTEVVKPDPAAAEFRQARRKEFPLRGGRSDHVRQPQPRAVPRLPHLHARAAGNPEAPAECERADRRGSEGVSCARCAAQAENLEADSSLERSKTAHPAAGASIFSAGCRTSSHLRCSRSGVPRLPHLSVRARAGDCIEALSAGCLDRRRADTAPVRGSDRARKERTCWSDFFDDRCAERGEVCDAARAAGGVRAAARRQLARPRSIDYDLARVCLPQQVAWMEPSSRPASPRGNLSGAYSRALRSVSRTATQMLADAR